MCGAEPPGGFDTTHSRHVDVHQHDPSTAVRNEFDCRFPGFAIAGHGEIFGGRHGGGRCAPETGLVVDHPDSHLIVHLRMMRHGCVPHDGVHTTVFMRSRRCSGTST